MTRDKRKNPKNTEQLNIMMERSANENAAGLRRTGRRICKRSDQPKIERLVNNGATVGLFRPDMLLIFNMVWP